MEHYYYRNIKPPHVTYKAPSQLMDGTYLHNSIDIN